jgi:carbamoyltransferase
MNQVVKVKEEYRTQLPAVTHIDGTARIQTVHDKKSKIFKLLKNFETQSGFPILLNTSFNIKDKTMVLTPEDAFKTFTETDMDILVINNKMYYKNDKIN